MTQEDCPPDDRLRKWALGELSEDAADQITEHLDHCTRCEESLSSIEQIGLLKTPFHLEGYQSEPEYLELMKALEKMPVDQLDTESPTFVPPETFEQPDPDPVEFGRYKTERKLGAGGFGSIYLAVDTELHRKVAIKVPHSFRISNESDVQVYLDEAKTLAKLDHPHVVPIHDVGRLPDGRCYLVSKFVDGQDLWEELRRRRYSIKEAIELIATIADALEYVHQAGIIHRDIKPKNILLDHAGSPFLTDFGLAIQFENAERSAFLIGTPHYMSPEQARGEGHLVDGRSDLFSLGIVLYLLLTGVRPFDGSDIPATIKNVVNMSPRPLREVNPAIPKELERACLKVLSKRATDRYAHARLFAEDLRFLLHENAWGRTGDHEVTLLTTPLSEEQSVETYVSVTPRGLRSFDNRDANFFMNLLPGPRNREGHPESIQIWKDWIESSEQSDVSRVGVIYGPSGCGKSSFIKAGVLPLLKENIVKVVVECAPTGTEQRLLRTLREKCLFLKPGRSLFESLTDIRLGRGLPSRTKVLLVFDQFEQWLHGAVDPENSELALALRQCDGEHLQSILMVRDDFWLVLSRLMSVVEIPLVLRQNLSLVDLFDPIHARDVLKQFGQAFRRIPIPPAQPVESQEYFLDEVISDLTVDGKVFPVRIALFAEMLKGRPWSYASLLQLGGIQGIGTMFLEEAFTVTHAPAHQKIHEQAAREVLRSLLPDQGTNIKVSQKTATELRDSSSYRDEPELFEQLLRILETDLKLISPTEAPEAASMLIQLSTEGSQHHQSESKKSAAKQNEIKPQQTPGNISNQDINDWEQEKYYQLSHDYLIPSLREWLTRREMQTFRGRLGLQFEDRVSLWSARPQPRNLPTWWEWVQFKTFLSSQPWGQVEKKMMSLSTRTYAFWTFASCLLAVLFFIGAGKFRSIVENNAIIAQIPSAQLEQVPGIMKELQEKQSISNPKWQNLLLKSGGNPNRELAIHLALLPDNPTQVEPVIDRAILTNPNGTFTVMGREFKVISNALKVHQEIAVQHLWKRLNDKNLAPEEHLRAAILLAPLAPPTNTSVTDHWKQHITELVAQLEKEDQKDPAFVNEIIPEISTLADLLAEPMLEVLGANYATVTDFRRTVLLSEIIRDEPALLAKSILLASKWQIPNLLSKAEKHQKQLIPILKQTLQEVPDLPSLYDVDDLQERRHAMAVTLLYKWGENVDLIQRFELTESPAQRSFIIQLLAEIQAPQPPLVEALKNKSLSPGIRSALLQALGNYFATEIPVSKEAIQLAENYYRSDPDPGVHGSAEWFLKQSGIEHPVELIPANNHEFVDGRGWYIDKRGTTFTRIDATEEPLIQHVFDISAHEVTVADFLKYDPDVSYNKSVALTGDSPIIELTWYETVKYCRWLSEQADIPEEEMCYPSIETIDQAIAENGSWSPDEDHHLKTAYRLPNVAEWEFACQGKTLTSRHFGNSERLMAEYSHFGFNKGWMGLEQEWNEHTWPVGTLKPNEYGLFDMFGNVQEWCVDANGYRNEKRKMRGGGYGSTPKRLLVRLDQNSTPAEEWLIYGMRLVRTVKAKE